MVNRRLHYAGAGTVLLIALAGFVTPSHPDPLDWLPFGNILGTARADDLPAKAGGAKAPVAKANNPKAWVGFHGKTTGRGPTLTVEAEGLESAAHKPAAETVIISYLADRNWSRLPTLSLDLADTNRVLIRFDVPAAGSVRKAELVLRVAPADNHPTPTAPYDLGVYPIDEAWKESAVTWNSQPRFAASPAVTARVDPKAEEIRIDVTALVRRQAEKDAPGHGWLLKVVHPLAVDGPAPGENPGGEVERELLALFPWAPSAAAAVEQAGRENKLVLALVRSEFDAGKSTYLEQVLLAAVLADPDVRTLIRERFVPVRVTAHPFAITMAGAGPAGQDPLVELGTSVPEAKPTALVVSNGKSVIVRMANIGTADRDLTLRFLLIAVAKLPPPEGEKGPWKRLAQGRLEEAARHFSDLGSREGRYGLVRVAALRGDHAEAVRLARPLAQSDGPFRDEARVQAGRAYMRLGRFDEALPFLREAVGGTGAAEASYDLGCLLYRTGAVEKARAAWEDVVRRHAGSPPAARAKARLAWPHALAMYESLTALDLSPADRVARRSTEVDRSGDEARAVRLGIDYLLAQQGRDGTWQAGSQAGTYRVAITALAARSLQLWGGKLDADRRDRIRAATAKATAWLNGEVGRADPETTNSFGAAYLLDYFLDLEEMKTPVRGDVPGAVRLLLAGQCPNGAWSYDYRFAAWWAKARDPKLAPGRTHSMNTGLALLTLARAKRLGFEVDAQALGAGRKSLLAMRDTPGVYTYMYPGPRNFNAPDASAPRGPLCEHALYLLGAVPREDVGTAVELFRKYRADLRAPVKVWGPTWLPPHGYTSYFFFFAYAHAARAMLADGGSADRLDELRSDLLRVQEADGTWVDFEPIGKPYGTAMALHVLFLAREGHSASTGRP
jgi:tetratricopeptide (TPR) repeat protein